VTAALPIAFATILAGLAVWRRAGATAAPTAAAPVEYDIANQVRETVEALSVLSQTNTRRTSPEGVDAIKRREGFRSDVYDDGAGYPTIGYGHKLTADEIGKLTQVSFAQASTLLRADLAAAEAAVMRFVTVPLQQSEFDALVSLVFNIGAGAFRRSTLLRRLNAGDRAGTIEQFGRWVFANGRRMAGLATRRADEAMQFRGGLA
jgi:lysozyme